MTILKYNDYLSFLNDHFLLQKSKNRNWSYGAWAKHIGLKSTSSLTKILNNERHPGYLIAEKLCRYFKFSDGEKNYFKILILFSRIEQEEELLFTFLVEMNILTTIREYILQKESGL